MDSNNFRSIDFGYMFFVEIGLSALWYFPKKSNLLFMDNEFYEISQCIIDAIEHFY